MSKVRPFKSPVEGHKRSAKDLLQR